MNRSVNAVLDRTSGIESLVTQVDVASFGAFVDSFPLQGEQLFNALFERHTEIVQTQKAKFAVANLEKILTGTFDISSTSGFEKMSLRDLSRQTGMSMGAIYSCISKKEDIALMVADIVRMSSQLTRQHAMQEASYWSRLEQTLRFHLYASTLLQPWYFFLYFETRSLPEAQQTESKQIELDAIDSLQRQISAGVDAGEFHTSDAEMVANCIVVMLQDWYLKPWKTQLLSRAGHPPKQSLKAQEEKIDHYYRALIELVRKLLARV